MSHYHFIGIGGISMSGIAMILKDRGHKITGSDRSPSPITKELEKAGITVCYGQRAENIVPGIDTVVFTAAIHEDNPELIEARKRCPRVIERSVMLGELLDEYADPIAVSGTHGKTSTSSMLAYIYEAAGMDPSFAIGGIVPSTGANYRVGHSDRMVIEACEYHDSFLEFHPRVNIITNIEPEHLDYFKTFDNEKASFHKYVAGMRKNGVLVTSPELAPEFRDLPVKVLTVGVEKDADLVACNIKHHHDTLGSSFDVVLNGKTLGRCEIFVPGRHLIYDALCAIGAALEDDVPFDKIQEGLSAYRGPKRRFEMMGMFQGARVVNDYAHHPTEIKATLEAARELPLSRLVVVFQPHTFSRTIDFYDDFVKELSAADEVILADIYAAREPDTGVVSSKMLAESLVSCKVNAKHFSTFDEIEKYLKKIISTNDLLITMGAGNVETIAFDLTKDS